MAGFTLSDLNAQKSMTSQALQQARHNRAVCLEKIQRLQEASASLSDSLRSVQSLKRSIGDFEIGRGDWRGDRKTAFDKKYLVYKNCWLTYYGQVKCSKDLVDHEIRVIEQKRALYGSQIANLQSTLRNIEANIAKAERE